jgi:hypothetical protein
MLFLRLCIHLFSSLCANTTCTPSEDDIGSNLGEEEEQHRYKGAIEDDLA